MLRLPKVPSPPLSATTMSSTRQVQYHAVGLSYVLARLLLRSVIALGLLALKWTVQRLVLVRDAVLDAFDRCTLGVLERARTDNQLALATTKFDPYALKIHNSWCLLLKVNAPMKHLRDEFRPPPPPVEGAVEVASPLEWAFLQSLLRQHAEEGFEAPVLTAPLIRVYMPHAVKNYRRVARTAFHLWFSIDRDSPGWLGWLGRAFVGLDWLMTRGDLRMPNATISFSSPPSPLVRFTVTPDTQCIVHHYVTCTCCHNVSSTHGSSVLHKRAHGITDVMINRSAGDSFYFLPCSLSEFSSLCVERASLNKGTLLFSSVALALEHGSRARGQAVDDAELIHVLVCRVLLRPGVRTYVLTPQELAHGAPAVTETMGALVIAPSLDEPHAIVVPRTVVPIWLLSMTDVTASSASGPRSRRSSICRIGTDEATEASITIIRQLKVQSYAALGSDTGLVAIPKPRTLTASKKAHALLAES